MDTFSRIAKYINSNNGIGYICLNGKEFKHMDKESHGLEEYEAAKKNGIETLLFSGIKPGHFCVIFDDKSVKARWIDDRDNELSYDSDSVIEMCGLDGI